MRLERVGLQKTTLIDYPDKVASTVFTYGCNLRCPYCHNPQLVQGPGPEDFITIDEFFSFLEKRKSVLDGVCITGGEPLLYDDLPDFIEHIQELGLKVKLDTNGTLPERLKKTKPDYIAMDLKTVPEKYAQFLGSGKSTAELIYASLNYLRNCGIAHEVRTTWAPGIVDIDDIPDMAELLKGIEKYYITAFRQGNILDSSYNSQSPPSDSFLEDIAEEFLKEGITAIIR